MSDVLVLVKKDPVIYRYSSFHTWHKGLRVLKKHAPLKP